MRCDQPLRWASAAATSTLPSPQFHARSRAHSCILAKPQKTTMSHIWFFFHIYIYIYVYIYIYIYLFSNDHNTVSLYIHIHSANIIICIYINNIIPFSMSTYLYIYIYISLSLFFFLGGRRGENNAKVEGTAHVPSPCFDARPKTAGPIKHSLSGRTVSAIFI